MNYLYAVLICLGATYALWIFYLAVMNLARAKRAGLLTKTAMALGYPVLIVGYVLDCFVNFTVMTILLLEIPQETTVTARLSRHNSSSIEITNNISWFNKLMLPWRKALTAWAEPLLDPYDPSGDHI